MIALASLAFPHIDPVAVRLGPFVVRWYGLAYVAGFLAAGFVLWWLAQRWRLGLTVDDAISIVLAAVIGVLVGGRLGYVIFYGGSRYWRDPVEILRVWDGGMSFHGGLIGILIAAFVVAKILDMPWLTIVDLGSVGAPIGIFFGRIANFINGELWGRVTTAPWGIVFPGAGPLPRHPSQLYEAVLEGLLIFAVLFALALKEPPRPRGYLFGWFLTLYGVLRILAEFFRQPDVQIGFYFGGVTLGQILSLPVLAVGIFMIVWAKRHDLPQEGPHLSQRQPTA